MASSSERALRKPKAREMSVRDDNGDENEDDAEMRGRRYVDRATRTTEVSRKRADITRKAQCPQREQIGKAKGKRTQNQTKG